MRVWVALALMVGWLPANAAAAALQVTVQGVRNDHGHIRIGVCRKPEFLSEICRHNAIVPARPGTVEASIAGIPPGQYAVAVYQDVDGSGRLKRNFFGMPQEDLGFSRDPKLGMGAPSFANSAITIDNGNNRIILTLRHFGS
jgi:uncharacterized protein (DUF2141 family)